MIELLSKLCLPAGVPGDEAPAAAVAAELLKPLGNVYTTALGSVICSFPSEYEKVPHIMLTAHLDRIGLVVTRITDKGFLKVAPCGSPDLRSLLGARVTVHTNSGPICGVVSITPPHLSDGEQKPLPADKISIDIGMNAENAKSAVNPGDRITLDGKLTTLLGNRVSAAALDNRAGCAAIIRAAQLLAGTSNPRISVALVSQEETGSAGAATAANILAPDIAVAVDVSMAITPDDSPDKCGIMGDGPMIGIAPILERRLSNKLIDICKNEAIPYQLEVMGANTSTDADHIAVSGKGVKTALISIPLRFMHTPAEIVDTTDIENTALLIAKAVKGGGLC